MFDDKRSRGLLLIVAALAVGTMYLCTLGVDDDADFADDAPVVYERPEPLNVSSQRSTSGPLPKPKELACSEDLDCWAVEQRVDASYPCTKSIESKARFDVKWNTGWMEPKLGSFSWDDQAAGTIMYFAELCHFIFSKSQ